jgi:hypothetical protein
MTYSRRNRLDGQLRPRYSTTSRAPDLVLATTDREVLRADGHDGVPAVTGSAVEPAQAQAAVRHRLVVAAGLGDVQLEHVSVAHETRRVSAEGSP